MSEYNFLKDYCARCHKFNACVEIYDKKGKCQSLCELCLGWNTLINAETKDEIRYMMYGIEDLDNTYYPAS